MISRVLLYIMVVFLAFGCQQSMRAQDNTEPSSEYEDVNPIVAHLKAPMSNDDYPYDIELKKADGSIINSSDVLSNSDAPTIVTFWLTTCYPCKLELQAIKEKYAGWQKEAKFKMVAISTDFEKNYPTFARMVNENDWPWEAYNDHKRGFWKVMPGGLNGLPQVFVFDKNGEIAYYKRKYKPGDEDLLFEKVKSLQ